MQELTTKQKARVDKYTEKRKENLSFGPIFTQERTYFPVEIKELNILETPKQFLQILDKAGYYCPDFRQKYVYKKEDKLKNKPVKLINVISKELKNNVEKLNELKRKFDQRLTTSRKEMVECEICITHNPYDIARNVYRQKLDIMYGFRPRYT